MEIRDFVENYFFYLVFFPFWILVENKISHLRRVSKGLYTNLICTSKRMYVVYVYVNTNCQ